MTWWRWLGAVVSPMKPWPAPGIPPELADVARLTVRDGKWSVARSGGPGGPVAEDGEVEVRPFVTAPAYVSLRYSTTIPTAPYESCKVEISCSMPCYPAECDSMLEKISAFVGERVQKEREAIEQYAKQRAEGAT